MLDCWRSWGRQDMRDGGTEKELPIYQPIRPRISNLKSGLTKGELMEGSMGNCEFCIAITSVGSQLYI